MDGVVPGTVRKQNNSSTAVKQRKYDDEYVKFSMDMR